VFTLTAGKTELLIISVFLFFSGYLCRTHLAARQLEGVLMLIQEQRKVLFVVVIYLSLISWSEISTSVIS